MNKDKAIEFLKEYKVLIEKYDIMVDTCGAAEYTYLTDINTITSAIVTKQDIINNEVRHLLDEINE